MSITHHLQPLFALQWWPTSSWVSSPSSCSAASAMANAQADRRGYAMAGVKSNKCARTATTSSQDCFCTADLRRYEVTGQSFGISKMKPQRKKKIFTSLTSQTHSLCPSGSLQQLQSAGTSSVRAAEAGSAGGVRKPKTPLMTSELAELRFGWRGMAKKGVDKINGSSGTAVLCVFLKKNCNSLNFEHLKNGGWVGRVWRFFGGGPGIWPRGAKDWESNCSTVVYL